MKPRQKAKIVGFIISLSLFIIANFFQSSLNSKVREINGRISDIERNQEFQTKNMLMGKDCFENGQLYLTLGVMTKDEEHDISNIFNPVSNYFIQGLESLNATLPESDQIGWKEKIKKLSFEFDRLSSNSDLNQFYLSFSAGVVIFKELFEASNQQSEQMADQKNLFRIKAEGYSFYSNLLLIVNTIILLIQLFFNSLFDLFLERREEKQKAKLASPSQSS